MAETQTQSPAANDNPTLPPQAGEEIGKSGTFLLYGFISAEEYNRQLIGKFGLQQYDIMRRSDATVHSVLLICKNPIIGADWDIEPASDDPIDVEIAEFCERELFGRKVMWPDVMREALSCLDFGHSVFELVYEPCEFNGKARIGLAKIASRKQRSIMRWATKDGKPGITQVVPVTDGTGDNGPLIDIPRDKLVYVINEREGQNYEGISLLRYAYKPWYMKDNLEIMHAIALEHLAMGIPIITKGANNETADETELQKARNALRQMRANEEAYMEMPASLKIEMLDLKANSTKDILPTIQYLDRQITLSVLAQFLLLGSGQTSAGSRAVSADHSQIFMKSLEAVARTIQQPFQQEVINRLVDLNYSNLPNGYPQLVFSHIDDDDSAQMATSIAALVTAGALTPDPDMENRIRDMLDIPQLTDDMVDNYDELPARTKPAPVPPAGVPPTTPAPAGGKPNDQEIEDGKDMPVDDSSNPTLANARKIQADLLELILKGV